MWRKYSSSPSSEYLKYSAIEESRRTLAMTLAARLGGVTGVRLIEGIRGRGQAQAWSPAGTHAVHEHA